MKTPTSASTSPNLATRVGSIAYFLWGVMHIWVAMTVVYRHLTEGSAGALRALGSPAAGIDAGAVLDHAANVASDFAINLGAAGLLACWLAVLVWRGSRLARWLNAVILGLVDLSFVICLLGPGYIPLAAGIWGPVLYAAGVVLAAIGARRREMPKGAHHDVRPGHAALAP